MVRRVLTSVVASVWLMPAHSSAQAFGAASTPPVVIHHNPPSPSPAPATPPQVSPAPATTDSSTPGTTDLFRAGPDTYAPRYDRLPSRRHQRFLGGYGYGSGYVADSYGSSRRRDTSYDERSQIERTGYLRLQVLPVTAQVYIDGLYVGVAEDFSRSSTGRAIEIGPHRVEIRAEGFETVTLDVRILPNETITYRRDLRKIEERPEPRVPVAPVETAPRTFYVIPRCYAGDTRPRAERLPVGCFLADVRTMPTPARLGASGRPSN